MNTLVTLLGKLVSALVALGLAVGGFVGGFVQKPMVVVAPPTAATTTMAASTKPLPLATSVEAGLTTAAAKSKLSEQKSGGYPRTSGKEVSTTQTPPSPSASQETTVDLNSYNDKARAALVNIFCTTGPGGSFNPISGSGVVVSPSGIILTNAHVAQWLLLRDYPTAGNVDCVVRTGSPAQPLYRASLLYLPPAWIADNAQKITQQNPTGTGENDYAFLYITSTTNPSGVLPASFSYLDLDGISPGTGAQMLVAAYPAGFLGGIAISNNLYASSAIATVGQLYNFHGGTDIDLYSLGGTVVSQAGSSGGAVVNSKGALNGIIVTEVAADTTSGRDLRALTLSHIDRSLRALGQGGLVELLSQDPAVAVAHFAKTFAAEEARLVDVLDKP